MTAAGSESEPPLVLIVDDDERSLALARDVLRAGGLRTVEASSGAEAVALANAESPDVILLDLNLPDRDGVEVARELASGARTAGLPVVALTAYRFEGDDRWLRAAGFAGYLEKPISVTEFPAQVRGYVGRD